MTGSASTGELASVDGELMPAAQARVPATDEGLLRGDGVFEAVRLYGGRPFALGEHLERLATSARNLRLPVDHAAVAAEVDALLAACGPREGSLRIVCTRGGHRVLLTEPLPALPAAGRLGYVTYAPPRVLDGIKSLSYGANRLASRLARERGFDEALLVTPHGRVIEAPTATLFWVAGEDLCTPPLSDHILASITRRIVREECGARERPCRREDLATADEVFLASSLREAWPIAAIEDRALPQVPGPVTRRVAERVRARIESELASARR